MHWTCDFLFISFFSSCFFFLLLPEVPPEVTLSGPHSPITEGDNVTLTCNITDGDPKPQLIRWLKDKTPVDVKGTSMALRSIKKKDEGNYICETRNEGGSVNGSINITVDSKTD